jgi:hypothetical protein
MKQRRQHHGLVDVRHSHAGLDEEEEVLEFHISPE